MKEIDGFLHVHYNSLSNPRPEQCLYPQVDLWALYDVTTSGPQSARVRANSHQSARSSNGNESDNHCWLCDTNESCLNRNVLKHALLGPSKLRLYSVLVECIYTSSGPKAASGPPMPATILMPQLASEGKGESLLAYGPNAQLEHGDLGC